MCIVEELQTDYIDLIKSNFNLDKTANYFSDMRKKLKPILNTELYFLFIKELSELRVFVNNLTAKIEMEKYLMEDAESLDRILSTLDEMPWIWVKTLNDDRSPENEPYRNLRRALEGKLMQDIDAEETQACLKSLVDLRYKYAEPHTLRAFETLQKKGYYLFACINKLHGSPEYAALCMLPLIETMTVTLKESVEAVRLSKEENVINGKSFFDRILDSSQGYSEITDYFTKHIRQYDKKVIDIIDKMLIHIGFYKHKKGAVSFPDPFKFTQIVLKNLMTMPYWKEHLTDKLFLKYNELLQELLEDKFPPEFKT